MRLLPLWAILPAMFAGVTRTTLAETWAVAGRTYFEVRVRETTAASVTIFHRGGITQLDLADLPPELQQRFGFDPGKAAIWRETAEEQLSASRAIRARKHRKLSRAHGSAASTEPSSGGNRMDLVEYRDEVDLRPVYREHGLILKNQGRRPSCSVFAVLGALEYEMARHTGDVEPLSEDFLIWAVRELQPGIPIDDGYNFSEVVAALQTYGVPTQEEMPNTFGKKIEDIQPTPDVIRSAKRRCNVVPIWFRADDPQLVDRLVHALNEQTPVIVGVRWPHWRTLRHNNLLRDQKPLEGGGHAVTLIGYQAPQGEESVVFLFRNSYGIDWGLGGCGFMAASYLREHVIGACILTLPEAPVTVTVRD